MEELVARVRALIRRPAVVRTLQPEVGDILLDLTRRETQAFSIAMAQAVVGSFQGQISLINNPHRHAGFRVLQAPDVPSVLLELGFLSNKDDEKLLLDPVWREKVSALLVEAMAMLVFEPTLALSGRAMMLRCLQRLPLMVASENITENGAWFANRAGGIPPILLDITTNGLMILSPFPFLPSSFLVLIKE